MSAKIIRLPAPLTGDLIEVDSGQYFLAESLEEKRRAALALLGERWLLHSANSPKKGIYDGWPKK